GCTVSTNCSVKIAEMLTCNATINNNIDCINTTGSVTLQGFGGSGVFQYSTSENGSYTSDPTFTGLSEGEHTFWVADMHEGEIGCKSSCTVTILEDNDPPTCSISGPGIINCNTPDGQIVLTASTDATNASFTWSATGGGNIVSGQGTSEIVVNAAGNYEVTIVDTDNGCFSVCSKEVILDTNIPNCNGGGNYVLNCEN